MNVVFQRPSFSRRTELVADDFVSPDGTMYDGTRFIDAFHRYRNPISIEGILEYSTDLVLLAYEQQHSTPAHLNEWIELCTEDLEFDPFDRHVRDRGLIAYELLLRDDVSAVDKARCQRMFHAFVNHAVEHVESAARIPAAISKHPHAIEVWLDAIDDFVCNHVGGEQGYAIAFRVLNNLFRGNDESDSPAYRHMQQYNNMLVDDMLSYASAEIVLLAYNDENTFHRNVWPVLVNQLPRLGGSRLIRARRNLQSILNDLFDEDTELKTVVEEKLADYHMQI